MKKLIVFCLFLISLFLVFILFSNRVKDYELQYEVDEVQINERFNKNENNYYFSVKMDDTLYDFVLNHKYTKNRKLVKDVETTSNDNYKCLKIKVYGEYTPYICYDGNRYYDGYMAGILDYPDAMKLKDVNQVSIFNESYEYYIWNGYGLTNIIDNKEYKFLKNESYDNKLSYQLGDNLLVADYDDNREFSKFYVFNSNKNSVLEFKFDFKISFNSYFMGDYDNAIYLFDRKNKIQYKINIEDNKIEVVSSAEGARYYQDGWDEISLNKLVYNDLFFEKTNLVNYSISDNNLYYNYIGSHSKICIDDDVNGFVAVKNSTLYYLKKDKLYQYNINQGRVLLLSYFEWNFSYNNKIFIFD